MALWNNINELFKDLFHLSMTHNIDLLSCYALYSDKQISPTKDTKHSKYI